MIWKEKKSIRNPIPPRVTREPVNAEGSQAAEATEHMPPIRGP